VTPETQDVRDMRDERDGPNEVGTQSVHVPPIPRGYPAGVV